MGLTARRGIGIVFGWIAFGVGLSGTALLVLSPGPGALLLILAAAVVFGLLAPAVHLLLHGPAEDWVAPENRVLVAFVAAVMVVIALAATGVFDFW